MKLEKVIAVRNSKTIYRDGSYVIKVFDEGYSKADILNEALNIARVEETGLPIPHVEEVTKIEGKWAIVTDYAEGKTIAQLMAENPDKKDEYLERFVDIQIEVQSKTCPMLNRLKEKMKRKISQTGLDATLGYGGHPRRMLERLQGQGHLYATDVDPIEKAKRDNTSFVQAFVTSKKLLIVVRMVFSTLPRSRNSPVML